MGRKGKKAKRRKKNHGGTPFHPFPFSPFPPYTEVALLAKQLQDLGVKMPILTGDGAQVPELVSIGGEAVNGMYFTALFHRQGAFTEIGRKFMQAFKSTDKKPLDGFGNALTSQA